MSIFKSPPAPAVVKPPTVPTQASFLSRGATDRINPINLPTRGTSPVVGEVSSRLAKPSLLGKTT